MKKSKRHLFNNIIGDEDLVSSMKKSKRHLFNNIIGDEDPKENKLGK